ncbi:zinc finger protein and SCAN domain-containing protein 22 isoform X1 [Sigmodon hispidus]
MEHEEGSCKQNNTDEIEPQDMGTETLIGGVSPKSTFGHTCKPKSSSESQPELLRALWMKSAAQEMDFRKDLGPHMFASKDEPGYASDASGNSSNMWPNFPSQDKAPSEMKFGPLYDYGTVPPHTDSGKKPST